MSDVVHDPVLLGLGANVGDAMTQLAAAVELIDEIDGVEVTDVSSVYATPPWPPPDDPRHVPQADYLNLVVRARASIGPEALLAATLELEGLLGTRVHLTTRVKVAKDWQQDPRQLGRLGL